MDDLLGEFVSETLEMMEALSSQLVAWETDPSDRTALDGVFRLIHTVKGSSSFFDLPRITALAHAAEELLDVLRDRVQDPDPACVATVLDAFDRIRDITASVGRNGSEPVGDDSALVVSIHSQLRRTGGDRRAAVAPMPATATVPEEQKSNSAPGSVVDSNAAWRSVRVPLPLLDELMNGVSDLVLARNEVAARLRADGVDVGALAPFERLTQLISSVRGSVSQMRMAPLRNLFNSMPLVARQLADELGKKIRLFIEGGEVEIDREVMEALRDPMTHILRNAVDHGVETPEDRQQAGKPAHGTLRIAALQSGNRILIMIEDDGRGLSIDKLVNRALASGRVSAEQADAMSPMEKAQLVFLPGLSTADKVTGISGRGVGMDVVKANIEKLGGTAMVDSTPGQGMTLTIDVPMTLSIVPAISLKLNGQGFAIPRSAVQEVLLATNGAIRRETVGETSVVRVRGRLMPSFTLEDALDLPSDPAMGDDQRSFVICRLSAGYSVVIDTPDVQTHEELVIKPLPQILLDLGVYSGLSLPDDGHPMLILDIEGMARKQRITDIGQSDGAHADLHEDQAEESEPWLRYSPYDSLTRCAIPMHSVERVVDVATDAMEMVKGHVIACIDSQIIAVALRSIPNASGRRIRMIQIADGERQLLLPTSDIDGLVNLPIILHRTADATELGVTMIGDDMVEMINPVTVLKNFAVSSSTSDEADEGRTLWIVDGQGGTGPSALLATSLRMAGYCVQVASSPGEVPVGEASLVFGTGEAEQASIVDRQGQTLWLDLGDSPALERALREIWQEQRRA